MSVINLKANNVFYLLIIFGLLLIIAANAFDYTIFKIDIDETVASLGALFLLIGGVQWLYDISIRKQLFEEITSLTIQNMNVIKSGIDNVISNSKDVNYSDSIRQSSSLTIGLNYSPRILEDYIDEFKERVGNKLNTQIIILNPSSSAGKYISSIEEDEHIPPNLKKIKNIIVDIEKSGKGKISIIEHSTILKYSFLKADMGIWIKPYKNSQGRSKIPAIRLKRDSDLFNFFKNDIESLIEQESTQ